MSQTLKEKVLSGVFWQGLSNAGNYIIGFVISIILARLLTPEDFGVVAIVNVFTVFFSVFIDAGFGSALVQKNDLKPVDCSSVFFMNLVMAGIIYALLFFGAPWIAEFYARPELTACVRVLALTIVVSSFSIVQGAMICREMQFYLNFRISMWSNIGSGIVGAVMAFTGYGVWALIAQMLLKAVLTCILQWCWGSWRPVMAIDFRRLRSLFQFGGKLFCSGVLDCLYNNIYPLLLGRLFNLSTLSYYNRGNHIPNQAMSIINSTLGTVLFPAFSRIRDDKEKMQLLMQKALKNIMFLVLPCMALLFAAAEPFILILFGEQWRPAIPFMQIFCVVFSFWPLHTTNLQVLTACGRTDVFLILEIIKKAQLFVIILLTYKYGPLAMAGGLIVSSVFSFIENAWMSRKLANYGIARQVLDLLPIAGIAAVSAAVAYAAGFCIQNNWLKAAVESLVFCPVYLAASLLLKQIPQDVINLLKSKNPLKKVSAHE